MPAPQRVRVEGDLFHGVVPIGAVYVGRSAPGLRQSRYRNLHRVGKPCRACSTGPTHDLLEALALYERDLYGNRRLLAAARTELAGRDLACWCRIPKLGEPDLCHASITLRASNEPPRPLAVYPPGPKPYGSPASFAPLIDVTPIGGLL